MTTMSRPSERTIHLMLLICGLFLSACAGMSGPSKSNSAANAVDGVSPGGNQFEATHVTLFDNGLAQFQWLVDVKDGGDYEIQVQRAHLDDLLASLSVVTDGNVKVTGARYDGVRNLGQAVNGSGFGKSMFNVEGQFQVPQNINEFLAALVGTKVNVQTTHNKSLTGLVLACTPSTLPAVQPDDDEAERQKTLPKPQFSLLLVTDEGALIPVPTDTIAQIQPVSGKEALGLKDLANQLGSGNGLASTKVVLSTSPDSNGRLAASYIRQAPKWRTTYKITTDGEEFFLEAWAIVHNDTESDWRNVDMTLVSGLPSSYVMSLASPRYEHRDMLTTESDTGSLIPQLGTDSPDSLMFDWQETIGYDSGGGTGSGYGRGAGGLSGRRESAPKLRDVSYDRPSSLFEMGQSAAEPQMEVNANDNLLTYHALAPVSIPKGASAMVPILRTPMKGEMFILLSEEEPARSCIWTRNDTGVVIPNGPASFYTNGLFRGQAEVVRMEPGDISLWCYSEEQDIIASYKSTTTTEAARLEWRQNLVIAHFKNKIAVDVEVENKSGTHRNIALLVDRNKNSVLSTTREVLNRERDLDTTQLLLLPIAGNTTHTEHYSIVEGIENVNSVTLNNIAQLLKKDVFSEREMSALNKAREALQERDDMEGEKQLLQRKINEINNQTSDFKRLLTDTAKISADSRAGQKILDTIFKNEQAVHKLEEHITQLTAKQEQLIEKASSFLHPFVIGKTAP
jgi:hypothetical protein